MDFIRKWRKKREILHDFKEIVRMQKGHLDELVSRRADIEPDVFNVMKFILEESIGHYNSIIVLFKKDQFQACLLIGRSIIESSINLQYILRSETERKAKNFILHSTTSFIKGLRSIKEEMPGKVEMLNYLEELEEQLQKSGSKDFHWDGKSFKQICDELGLSDIYEAWYSRLSKYVHSQYKGTRDFEQERPYNDFLKRLITKDMYILTLQTLKDINEKYNLLEGGATIFDYPQQGAVMVFSISSKKIDDEVTEQLSKIMAKK